MVRIGLGPRFDRQVAGENWIEGHGPVRGHLDGGDTADQAGTRVWTVIEASIKALGAPPPQNVRVLGRAGAAVGGRNTSGMDHGECKWGGLRDGLPTSGDLGLAQIAGQYAPASSH